MYDDDISLLEIEIGNTGMTIDELMAWADIDPTQADWDLMAAVSNKIDEIAASGEVDDESVSFLRDYWDRTTDFLDFDNDGDILEVVGPALVITGIVLGTVAAAVTSPIWGTVAAFAAAAAAIGGVLTIFWDNVIDPWLDRQGEVEIEDIEPDDDEEEQFRRLYRQETGI